MTKPPYVIVIPSYNRAAILKEKTLLTLDKANINKKHIYIFVANKNEYNIYTNTIGSEYNIIIGVKGITKQRQFIKDYFPTGKYIISIDDDVTGIYKLSSDKSRIVKIKDLDMFFTYAFNELKKYNLYLFGIYPVLNPFYMKGQKEVTTNLKFIIGTFYGFINRKDKDLRINEDIQEKEDVLLTLKTFIKDRGVLRFNHIGIKTRFKAAGGLGKIEDRFEANKYAAEYINKTYPEYTRIKIRKNGMYEIVLKRSSYHSK